MNKTIEYYEKNTEAFVAGTLDVGFAGTQNRFLSCIPENGLILDFGCGSGRDTKYFLEQGFRVEAVDGSESLCRTASKNTGIAVKQMLFGELDAKEVYDGIWACASVLHLPKEELRDVLCRMIRAVKLDGTIYTSFKYGEFEGYRRERYFTDFTEKSFGEFFKEISGAEIADEWVSADVRPGREDEKWLNLILRKNCSRRF